MSTYVLMKILESAPERYDVGIRMLTLGQIDRAYDRITSCVRRGQLVLDIGCGTGALTLRAARRGAKVTGMDVNPQMLEIARRRLEEEGLADKVELRERGVAELPDEPDEKYDVVMSGLCFSELTEDERKYALREIRRILKPGGLLLIADETRPRGLLKGITYWLIRAPLAAVTYIVTQRTTGAVRDLPGRIAGVKLIVESCRHSRLGDFVEIVARKPP